MGEASGYALVLGLVSGLACVGVRLGFRGLQWLFVQHAGLLPIAAAELSPWRRMITPILGSIFATAILFAVRRWTRDQHTVEYVEAVRFDDGRIPFLPTLWRTLSSAFSVATGAAVGREGSMIQFAASATSWAGACLPLRSVSLSRQVAYGAAAAVAAAYQAPFAAVFFALEIVIGKWAWKETLPLLVASTSGWMVSRLLLGAGPLFAVTSAPHISPALLWGAPLALLLGLCAPAYQALLRGARGLSRLPVALVWAGAVVGLLGLLHSTVWGNGDLALITTLQGHQAMSALAFTLVLRLIATTVCVGTGTVGGVFTPTLYAGAALGLVYAHILPENNAVLLTIVGLSAFLAAVTHAPFMAGFMAVELTGQYHLLPWLLVLNLLAWQIARRVSHHSLYAIATPEPAG